MTPWDMYEWADENIENKIFLCFNRGHCFTYQNHSEQADYCRNNWWHKKLSLFSTKWSNKAWAIYRVSWWDIDCLKIGHYLAAVYEGQWYPSLILEINWDQRDLLVKSMHNSGYDKNSFFRPPRDDIYHVPFTHIIGLTELPNIVGRYGRNSYKISAKLFELFNQNLSKLLNRKQ